MPWFALDDQGSFHEKVLAAGNEAYGAWCRAGQWSSAKLTEGRIPRHVALAIGPLRIWQRLEKVGLCDPTGGDDFQIHDFLDYNPSAEQVIAKREARATAGRAGGKKRAARQGKNLGEREDADHAETEVGEPESNEDKCPESLDHGQAIASANAKQLLEQTDAGEAAEVKQNSTPRARLPDPSIPSSAPTERVTAGPPPPPPVVSRPEPGPALPAPPGGQEQLGLVGCGSEAIRPMSSPRKAPGKPPAEKPAEGVDAVAWRTWRAAYRVKYRKAYSSASIDGPAMKRFVKSALDFLEREGRSPGDLEAILAHRWKRYLDDPGQSRAPGGKGFLQENSHALQFFERNVATYGSPWDASTQPPIRAAPVRPPDERPKMSPEQIRENFLAAQAGATG